MCSFELSPLPGPRAGSRVSPQVGGGMSSAYRGGRGEASTSGRLLSTDSPDNCRLFGAAFWLPALFCAFTGSRRDPAPGAGWPVGSRQHSD